MATLHGHLLGRQHPSSLASNLTRTYGGIGSAQPAPAPLLFCAADRARNRLCAIAPSTKPPILHNSRLGQAHSRGELKPCRRGIYWGASVFSALFSQPQPRPACVEAAAAHPHVWATVRSEIVFGPDHRITGIRHHWTFDEFYTAMAVQGLDANGDGVFSKEELQPLAQVNVESLKEFDYFTFVHLERRR